MNSNEKNALDEQLRAKFEGFKPEVPTGLWDKIATQLDAGEHRGVVPMNGKRRRFPTWWMSVAALLLLGVGIAYWYNRPVAVTYLQPAVATVVPTPAQPIHKDQPDETPVPDPIPLDVERLKRLFVKKARKESIAAVTPPAQDTGSAAETDEANRRIAENRPRPAVRDREVSVAVPTIGQPVETPSLPGEALAHVPNIEPLIPADEEETLLASAHGTKATFGISTILNYVVGTVDQREEKLVTFSNDSEGSLKLDFNFGLAKNKKKKLK